MKKCLWALAPALLTLGVWVCVGRMNGTHSPFDFFAAVSDGEMEAVEWDSEHYPAPKAPRKSDEPSKASFAETIDLIPVPVANERSPMLIRTASGPTMAVPAAPEKMPPCSDERPSVPVWMPYVTDKDE